MCFPSRWWCWSGIIITISLLRHFGRQCSCPSAERTLPQATPHRILRDNLTTAGVCSRRQPKKRCYFIQRLAARPKWPAAPGETRPPRAFQHQNTQSHRNRVQGAAQKPSEWGRGQVVLAFVAGCCDRVSVCVCVCRFVSVCVSLSVF